MKNKAKIVIAALGCLLLSWSSGIIALFALTEDVPRVQGILAIIAALVFTGAIIFAGWGNSAWEKENGSHGKR